MKPSHTAWQRLATAARRVEDARDTAAPYGFATRVAALGLAASERRVVSLFERLSWRALGVAALLAVACVAANYSAFTSTSISLDEELLSNDATLTALLDISS